MPRSPAAPAVCASRPGPCGWASSSPDVIAKFHETCPGGRAETEDHAVVRGHSSPGERRQRPPLRWYQRAPSPCRSSCGGERFLDMTWGIVAHRDHPLHAGAVSDEALADYPWIDFDAPLRSDAANGRPGLTGVLDQLYDRTGKRVKTVAPRRMRQLVHDGSRALRVLGLSDLPRQAPRATHQASTGRVRLVPLPRGNDLAAIRR